MIEGQRGQGRLRAESLVRKRFASCVIRDDHMAGRPRQMGPLWRGTAHPGTFRPARSGGYPGSHRRRKHHQRRHKGQCHRLPPGCDPRKRPGTPSRPTSFIVRKLRLTYNCSFLSKHSMPFQLSAALFQPLPGAHCEWSLFPYWRGPNINLCGYDFTFHGDLTHTSYLSRTPRVYSCIFFCRW